MSEWFKVIILGIVEGITEFLPISSTGHLIVTTAILNFQNSLNGSFEIFIQLGAVLAVLFYYGRDLLQQARTLPADQNVQRFWIAILIAIVPAGILGFLFRDYVKAVLFHPVVVALSLIIGGVLFLLIERRPTGPKQTGDVQVAPSITLRQAIIIGVAQTMALIPGVSRSGASIIGGMQAGLDRRTATQFSFYLALPTLGGATLVEMAGILHEISTSDLLMLLLGAAVSGVVAWLAIDWLLRYVSQNSFIAFGYYRIVAGALILLMAAVGLL